MSEELHYSLIIEWSDDDHAFLVTLPEWEGRVFNPSTYGETYEEAVKHDHEAMKALAASARKQGEPLPPLRTFAAHGR
ncbi:MAG: type II toxin-antitoxin system HicB family antitoxin [Chloroflexota bacterium]|nr:type II toxin-antitoxin system HicB family antitoxin [Chloroflexota bacterium]